MVGDSTASSSVNGGLGSGLVTIPLETEGVSFGVEVHGAECLRNLFGVWLPKPRPERLILLALLQLLKPERL